MDDPADDPQVARDLADKTREPRVGDLERQHREPLEFGPAPLYGSRVAPGFSGVPLARLAGR